MLYLDVIGMDVLVVNSLEAAIDLFERKSAVYADRVWLESPEAIRLADTTT